MLHRGAGGGGALVVFGRRVRALSRATQDRVADSATAAEETINASAPCSPTPRSGARPALRRRRRARLRGRGRARTGAGVMVAFVITLVFGAIVVVLWIGAQDVLAGRLSAGELSVLRVLRDAGGRRPGRRSSDVAGDLQRAAGATERLIELLAAAPDDHRRRPRRSALPAGAAAPCASRT